MEGQKGPIRLQHDKAIIPILDLPRHYREEIDRGISTGWKCLDKYLQGIRKGELTVITADTGVGKTTFCTQLIVNAALQGIPVWINSWEMKPESIMRKIASIILRRPMKMQNFTGQDNIKLDAWLALHPVYINPQTIGTDIDSLAQQLKTAKDLGIEIVMLDHLDYLVKNTKEKLHEAIDDTVRRLHELAFDLSIHLLLICHPRQSATSTDEIGMHMLKGSSSIKQYADNIIILHRCSRTDAQADPSKVKIKIAKNRQFGCEGVTYLFYQAEWDGFLELNDQDQQRSE